jgi:N-acetylglucosamine repressor
MGNIRRGNRNLIKAMNRNLILNSIRRYGPLSRTQLTETSGLSVGAISQIVGELLDDDWIIEVGEGESTGGRPQILLRLNPTAGYAVGIKLMEDRMVCAVTNLEVSEQLYLEVPLTSRAPQDVTAAISNAVRRAIVEAGITARQVLGVGIGLAGVVNTRSGVVHYSPFFKWHELPIGDAIAAELNLPVLISNDVNTLTITEQLFGDGHDYENFAVVTIGRGIGMGMVLHNQLYEGGPGGAGELGHITLEGDGPLCDCGKRGCLEALAADPAVIRRVRAGWGASERAITLADVVAAADAGDPIAREALASSGRYIGRGLSTLVNILCPALIIISGEGVVAGEYRLRSALEELRAHSFNGLFEHVRILVKPSDDRTWARGAAGLVVGKFFESPLVKPAEAIAG